MAFCPPSRSLLVVNLLVVLSAGCGPSADAALTPISVFATSAAYPWLRDAYECAPTGTAVVLAEGQDADLVLRLGEPQDLTAPAYKVGTDDLLVVVNPEAGVGALDLEEVQALFAGQITNWSTLGGNDLAVQVWVFAPMTDVQDYFDRAFMYGRPVSSLARLAVSSQNMSDSVGGGTGAIGLLPRRWKAGNTREALQVSSLPVLAVLGAAPDSAAAQLVACMQSRQ